jgi:hypothetical protein
VGVVNGAVLDRQHMMSPGRMGRPKKLIPHLCILKAAFWRQGFYGLWVSAMALERRKARRKQYKH